MTQLYSRYETQRRAKEIREFAAQGWNRKDLAHIFNVSQASISRILRNIRCPDENYNRCNYCKWNKNKLEHRS